MDSHCSGFNTFNILKQNLAKKLNTYMTEFAENAKSYLVAKAKAKDLKKTLRTLFKWAVK